MQVYYDKSELENDKTYQFIRDLDLPAEPDELEELSYKRSMTYAKDTEKKRRHGLKTDLPVINLCNSPEYCNVDTDENLTISKHSRLGGAYSYSSTGELFSTSQYNQQPTRKSDSAESLALLQYNRQLNCATSEALASSEYSQLNTSIYSSSNSGNYVDTSKNLLTIQYNPSDVQAYDSATNNTLKAMTLKQSQTVSAVWDVIDPLGKVRGLQPSVPETPIFSTGIVPQNKDSTQNAVASKTDSYKRPVIRYSKFVLYCPSECDVRKPEVDRPPGCKTVVVTGIPEKMKEDMVRDVFRKCGKIVKIRMRKSGCYITFASTSDVDKALKLSGYQVVIRDRREAPYCGKIHIDFVPIREEELQYERAKQKERDAMKNHGPIRSSLPHFSEAAANHVVDQLRNEDSLEEGVKLLVKWMEEGNCNRNNASSFFSVLQAMQGFVSRLMKDTAKIEEEVQQHQCKLKGKYAANALHFIEILKAFDIATSQKVWDHFSRTQKSRIGSWKKHIEEIKESNSKDLTSGRAEEKTNSSNGENSSVTHQGEELKKLQKENEQLKSELKLAKREGMQKKQKDAETSDKSQTMTDGGFSNDASSDNVNITAKEARLIALVGTFLNFYRYGEHIDSISKYVLKIDSSFVIEDIQSLLRKFPTVFKESPQEKKWIFLGM